MKTIKGLIILIKTLGKITKKILLAVFILSIFANTCFADKIHLPFSCYPIGLQKNFQRHGIKLDLSANDRTPESWGFLKSEGTSFWLYTYNFVTEEELEIIKQVIWEHLGVK